jgi:hypothetical protein
VIITTYLKDFSLNYFKFYKKRGYAESEIEAYFGKYDIDGNRVMSSEEMKKMREDLKIQVKKVEQDMDKIQNESEKRSEDQ